MACRSCENQCYCSVVSSDGSISVSGSGGSGEPYNLAVRRSASSGNALSTRTDGLYVASSSISGAWTNYTPTWGVAGSGVGTSPSVGNGTLTGRYTQIGKIMFVNISLSLGSTTTVGSGSVNTYWTFTVPVAQSTTASAVGSATSLDATVTRHQGSVIFMTNNTVAVNTDSASLWGPITPTGVTWGTGDYVRLSINYEVA